MKSFIALYRGKSVAEARLVSVSADPDLVATVTQALISQDRASSDDEALRAVEEGRRRALRLIRERILGEVDDEPLTTAVSEEHLPDDWKKRHGPLRVIVEEESDEKNCSRRPGQENRA